MLLAHSAYNAGRILTYAVLGAAAGAIGSGVGLAARMAGLASGARIFAGAAMVIAGVALLLPSNGLVTIERRGITSHFKQAIGRLMLSRDPSSKFQLGLLMGFLPCGMIYAALLKAVDAGSVIPGALTMLAFGLGTALALFAMGLVSQFAARYLGAWSNRLAAVSLMFMGAFLLWRGLAAPQVPHCHAHS
jgi:sulfite exporter TauE/SafE